MDRTSARNSSRRTRRDVICCKPILLCDTGGEKVNSSRRETISDKNRDIRVVHLPQTSLWTQFHRTCLGAAQEYSESRMRMVFCQPSSQSARGEAANFGEAGGPSDAISRTSMRYMHAYRDGALTLEQVIKTVKVYSSHRRIGVNGFWIPPKYGWY